MSTFTIAGHPVELTPTAVDRRLAGELPEPVHEHYVVVGGRRFPPKQVIAVLTGLDRADFTTHQARRILQRLGFSAARRSNAGGPARAGQNGERVASGAAEALRPFIGQWVAVRGDEVLVAAGTPTAVVSWLTSHGRMADSMFRVPVSEIDADGAAPA